MLRLPSNYITNETRFSFHFQTFSSKGLLVYMGAFESVSLVLEVVNSLFFVTCVVQ